MDGENGPFLLPLTSLYEKVACFSVEQKIGRGSSGEIYSGVNLHTGDKVALKFEVKIHQPNAIPLLMYEYKLYRHLGISDYIPAIHYFGNLEYHFVLVMDLLGPSLEDVFNLSQRRLSVQTVAYLAVQMVRRFCFVLVYADFMRRTFT